MADYVTMDDYFTDDWNSPCQSQADYWTDEVWREAKAFLQRIELRMSRGSEWAYSIQCSGVTVETVDDIDEFIPREVDEDGLEGSEFEFNDVYKRYYQRLRVMYEWLSRVNKHLCDAPIVEYGFFEWSYVRKRDQRIYERVSHVAKEYERLLSELCDELARAITNELDSSYESAHRDDVALDWVLAQGGVPVRKLDVMRIAGGKGITLDDGQYDEIVDLLGRYMEATKSSDVNDREVIAAARLVAA